MRFPALVAALVMAFAIPAYAQTGSASAQAEAAATGSMHVFLLAGRPGAAAKVIAATQLSAAATAAMGEATHADLRIGTRGFVFAIARAAAEGRAVGETLVRVNGRTRTLFSAAAELQAALVARGVVLFTEGAGRAGVIVAMVPAERARGDVSVAASGATHVTVLIGSTEETFALARTGATLASTMVVEAGRETDAAAEAQALIDVIVSIRVRLGD